MTASLDCTYITPEDYLAGERIASIKHEYIRGKAYAMAAATKAHGIVAGNLFSMLRNHLRGKECTAYMADMKVRLEGANAYFYPDVTVTYDSRDRTSLAEDFIRYPCLIVEFLLPTTAAFDRGQKFADYRTLEILEEYVLTDPERIGVDCFRRNTEGLWVLYPYGQGDEIELASVDFRCAIADLYEDLTDLGQMTASS